jgi:hypothetical protein
LDRSEFQEEVQNYDRKELQQPGDDMQTNAWKYFLEYEHHSESKCSDKHGTICDGQTRRLLYRRHIKIGDIILIGKESNNLEEVDAGREHSLENVYTVYSDPTRDSWERLIMPKLMKIPLSRLIAETGLSRRMLIKARTGQVRPHPRNQSILADAVQQLCPR